MRKLVLGIACGSLLALYSCKESQKETTEEQKTEAPAAKTEAQAELQQAEDSAQAAWKFMMEADDQKIAFLKRLLDEISYTKKYDAVAHARLVEKVNKLKSKRFDENTMKQSLQIDKYDAATDSAIKEVRSLTLSTPNIENYPLCSELLNDITALDNDVVMHRVKYDNWALKYNAILEEKKEALAEAGTPVDKLEKKGAFQLAQ